MRGLLVLCFAAICAADVSELNQDGYNYAQPAGSASGSGFEVLGAGDLGSATSAEPSFSNPAGVSGGFDSDGAASGSPSGSVSKRFFTINAEDNEDDDDDDSDAGEGHQSHDVVFANAPKQSLKSVLKAVSNLAGNQETAVYVLNKQLGAGEIADALRRSGIKPNKPQVHFVKYRTPEEAAHAQQQIRAQYDRFGGPSEFGGEESAPVRSFIGSTRGGFGGNGGRRGFGTSSGNYRGAGGRGFQASGTGLSNHYLPPRY